MQRTIRALATICGFALMIGSADARPRQMAVTAHYPAAQCVFDNDGHQICRGSNQRIHGHSRVTSYDGVIGGRPAGCPHAFCGCEASRYVFGVMRPDLYLASNWIRKFPPTSPAPGMVAARNHHVFVLIAHVEGSDWLSHDGNSGGGKTREHVVSISRYVIVDPHGSRVAMQ